MAPTIIRERSSWKRKLHKRCTPKNAFNWFDQVLEIYCEVNSWKTWIAFWSFLGELVITGSLPKPSVCCRGCLTGVFAWKSPHVFQRYLRVQNIKKITIFKTCKTILNNFKNMYWLARLPFDPIEPLLGSHRKYSNIWDKLVSKMGVCVIGVLRCTGTRIWIFTFRKFKMCPFRGVSWITNN